jgi:[ribosomal protein S18]-alanine N-acetyltransferase
VQIRPATIADIPSIMRIERQSDTAGHWTEEQYRQAFTSDGATRLVLVAEDFRPTPDHETDAGTTTLGFLVAQHLPPDWELENIVVAPSARCKGLGQRLLEALLAAARETNSNRVFLEVRESNVAARALYEKAGFEQFGRRKSYYLSPAEDAILYCRSLS